MNKKVVIFVTGLVTVAIALGTGVYYLNRSYEQKKTSKIENSEVVESLKKEIQNNTEFTTTDTIKTFKNIEDAQAFAETISTINGIDEASDFINNFYKSAEKNKASASIGFYYPDYRYLVENAVNLPFLDTTNQTYCKIENIQITDKGENVYTVSYKLDMYDKSDKDTTPFYTMNREDTVTLVKNFGKIYVIDYIRNTTDSQKLR